MSAAASLLAEHGVHADRDGLHVMPPELLQGAVTMQEECKEFLSKTKQFNDIVGDFIDVMESKSKVIEAEKLRAIGFGNRVDHEKEVRKRKQVRRVPSSNPSLPTHPSAPGPSLAPRSWSCRRSSTKSGRSSSGSTRSTSRCSVSRRSRRRL